MVRCQVPHYVSVYRVVSLQEFRLYWKQTLAGIALRDYGCITEPQKQQLTGSAVLLRMFTSRYPHCWHKAPWCSKLVHGDCVKIEVSHIKGLQFLEKTLAQLWQNRGEPWRLFRLDINSCFNVFHVLEGEISEGTGVVCRSLSVVWYLVVYCWSWLPVT